MPESLRNQGIPAFFMQKRLTEVCNQRMIKVTTIQVKDRGAKVISSYPEAAKAEEGQGKEHPPKQTIFSQIVMLGYSLRDCALSPEGGGAITS